MIPQTMQTVFSSWKYKAFWFVGSLVFLGVYVLIPVLLVSGNSVTFEFSQAGVFDYVLLVALATATALLMSFELFAFRRSRAQGLPIFGESGVGIVASITGGVLAAASCGCGIGILLGVLGLGGATFFVSEHQMLLVGAMLGLVLVGLYFSARRAAGICATCTV